MAGFTYFPDGGIDTAVIVTYQLAASQSVRVGDAVKFSGGKVTAVSGQTDVAIGIIVGPANRPASMGLGIIAKPAQPILTDTTPLTITTTATSEVFVHVLLAYGGLTRFKVAFTPLLADVAAESNAVTTTVKAPLTDGSTSDLVGGYVFCKELGEARLITANTYSSNIVTITCAAMSRAVTTGDTVRVCAFGPGDATLKFDSTAPSRGISNVIADLSSGKVTVHDVDLPNKTAIVSFNPS